MKPENFGPVFWNFIHLYGILNWSILSPEKMNDFLDIIYEGIPCQECKAHMKEFRSGNKFNFQGFIMKYGGAIHLQNLHNNANENAGGKIYTFEEKIDEMWQNIKNLGAV